MKKLLFALLLAMPAYGLAQNVYFGNLHAHSSYSDGRGIPDNAFASAEAAGLDFFAVTEHNHAAADGKGDARDGILIANDPTLYSGSPNALVEAANRHNVDGRFVALFGQEFSTISSGNHINVIDVPVVLRSTNGRFDLLATEVGALRDSTGAVPLLQFNHPRIQRSNDRDYGRDDFADERTWVATMDPLVELIEVLNAPALSDGTGFRSDRNEPEYFRYLNLGFHISPSAGHDNHYRNWGTSTDARVAVIAPSLTRANILQALRQRHTYATEDRNLRVIFRANGALGGDIIAPPADNSELALTVELKDDDEPGARYRIDVYQDQPGGSPASAPVETFEVVGDTPAPARLDGVTFAGEGSFVLLRITQFRPDDDEEGRDDRVWTAPVWFEASAQAPQVLTARIRIAALLPNPAGDERLNETITLRNGGSSAVDLAGWQLRDLAGNLWSLDTAGTLAGGQETTLRRGGQALSLNNNGETVELLDPTGAIVDTVSYGIVAENEVIRPPSGP